MNSLSNANINKASSFVMIMKTPGSFIGKIGDNIDFDQGRKKYLYVSEDNQMEVAFALRNESVIKCAHDDTHDCGSVLLGDDCEWKDSRGRHSMANAVFIEYNLKTKFANIISSIVGLPPVFIYKKPEMVIITSDLYLLTMIPGLRLYFNFGGKRFMLCWSSC